MARALKTRPRAAILGGGAIGIFLAVTLSRAGWRITLVVQEKDMPRRGARLCTLRRTEGATVSAKITHTTQLAEPVDALFIAVKANALSAALARTPRACVANGIVVSLLNGVEHMPMIRTHFGRRVLAGSIGIEVFKTARGTVMQTTRAPRIQLAPVRSGARAQKARALVRALIRAGIETSMGKSERAVLWGKLGRLAPLALTTALSQRTIGFVRTDKTWRGTLARLAHEVAAVAQAEGVSLSAEGIMEQIDHLAPIQRSSLARDVRAGRPNEADAIGGAVVRAGKRHGISCPTISTLLRQIRDAR